MKINSHFNDIGESYLFSTISRRVAQFKAEHPDSEVISLGIGDVTRPLCPAVTEALAGAVADMSRAETFRGYGPDQGYDFLREAIRGYYGERGVDLGLHEIYIGDGAKCDLGNIVDLFSVDNRVLIPDPVYPVYVDTNVMAGREVSFLDANAGNGFAPVPGPDTRADIIYLCSPNNPTGVVYTREQLSAWVEYALAHDALILFDAAYEAFVTDPALPRSIFEVQGARDCAIEFCSLSKTAGFTGVRCGYTVVPDTLQREGAALGRLWLRRQATKFNGVSYITQRGAAAAFSPQGRRETREAIDLYRANARVIADSLRALGVWFTGGDNSPYVWLRCPGGRGSWDYFDHLLNTAHVVGTPGAGFGKNGEGYFRLTAFNTPENTKKAMEALGKAL